MSEEMVAYEAETPQQQNGAQPPRRRFRSGADILARDDQRIEEVEVPEWGTWVRVRALNGRERDDYIDSLFKMRGNKRVSATENATARLVMLCTVDEDGNRLWGEADLERLGRKNAAALNRIGQVAQRLAGLTDDEIGEITKNSPSDQSDDSGSI